MKRNGFAPVWLLFAAISTSGVARAEGFVDLRIAGAFTEHADARATFLGTTIASGTADLDDSLSGGVRLGYWPEFLPWLGAAIDVSYFAPDDDGADINVIPISPLLMARLPLAVSDEYPHGRVRPYVGVGPGIFVSQIDVDGLDYSDTATDVGVDARGGLNVQLMPALAIFLEYRYTRFRAKFDGDVGGSIPVDIKYELATHHVGAGLEFLF